MDSNTAALGFIVSRHHLSADVGIRASEGSGLRVVCVVVRHFTVGVVHHYPHASFSSHGEATGKDNRGVLMVGSVPARAYHADGLCTTIPFPHLGELTTSSATRVLYSCLCLPAASNHNSWLQAMVPSWHSLCSPSSRWPRFWASTTSASDMF